MLQPGDFLGDRHGRIVVAVERLEVDALAVAGELGVLADIGLPEAVLGVIIADDDYADEQLSRIAQEMGFGDELSAVVDKLDRR